MQERLRGIRSFSLVATEPCKKEAALLIYSIRRIGYECPVLVLCDDPTHSYLRQFEFGMVAFRNEANPQQLPEVEVDKKNSFHKPSIILKKMDAMDWGILECGNTMFLDSDILFLREFNHEICQPTMLSPHYGRQVSADSYGAFNAGYLYTEEPDLPDRWRYLYLNRSRFYEQECMSLLFENFDCGKFSKHHNVGFWRDVDFSEELVVSVHQHFDSSAYADASDALKGRYDRRRKWWLKRLPDDILEFMGDVKLRGA